MSLLRQSRFPSFRPALLLLAIAASVGGRDAAAQVTWSKGAGTYNWNTAANWNTNAVPLVTSTAVFSNSTAGVPGSVSTSTVTTATSLFVTTGGYGVSNSGTSFLVLTYNNSTGSATTDAASVLWVNGNSSFDIGTGTDSTVVKLNGGNAGFSSQVLLGSGSGATRATLNINSSATVLRDNSPGNGGLRFVGSGTVNLFGTVSLLQGADGIRISERDNDTITFNVKSGGVMTANTTAANVSNGSIWVAGGAAGAGTGLNTLNIESGGAVTVVNGTTSFGLTRNAGPTSVTNLSGTLTAPRVINLASTGTLNFTGGTLKANAANANYITSGSFVGGTLASVSGGTIDNGGFSIGIGVGIGGAGGMAFAGNGVTTLTGASTYAGATAVNAGTLAANGSLTSNVAVASGATLTGSGTTTGSVTFNAGSVLLANTNGTELTGNGVTFAGQTLLQFNGVVTSGSTYDVIGYGAGGVTSLGNLVSTSRATIADDIGNSKITATALGVATETWAGGSGTWSIGGSGWTGTFSDFYNGDTAVFTSGTGPATISLSNSLGALLPAAVNVNSTTDFAFVGPGSIGGTAPLTKDGAAALTISSSNSYAGGTVLNAGTLNVNAPSALGTGTVTITGGTLGNSSGAAVTLSTNNPQSWTGDVAFAGPDNLNMGTGVVTLGGVGARTVTVPSGTLTVGRLSGTSVSGTFGLTKAGAGTLTLNPTAPSSIGDLLVADGTLNIGAQDLVTTGLSGSGTIANGSATTRRLIVNSATDSTFSGLLTDGAGGGRLGLFKQGAGTLTVAGSNSYSDTTTIGTGGGAAVIRAAATNALGTGLIDFDSVGNASTARLELAGGITLANSAVTLRGRNNASVAILNVSGSNTLNAPITVTVGGSTYIFQSDSGTLNLGGAISATGGSRLLTVTGSGNGILGGAISNGGGTIAIAKSGTGTWTLSGNSTYTGTTAVLGGLLNVNGDNSAATGAVTVAGGSLGGTGSLGGAITVGTGGAIVPGAGIGTLTGTQSVSFADGSTYVYEINSASVTADLLRVGTDLNLSGTVALTLTDLSASTPITPGTVLSLVNYGGSWNGGLLTYSGTALADGDQFGFGVNQFQIDYNSTTQGSNVTTPIGANYVNLVAVPEPTITVAALASLGLAGLMLRRRDS
jgi:fibronectin-binding autotransporter adhesin